jgi:hypothetical protein
MELLTIRGREQGHHPYMARLVSVGIFRVVHLFGPKRKLYILYALFSLFSRLKAFNMYLL